MPSAFSQMRWLFPPTHRILGHETFSWFAAKFLLPCRAQFAQTMSFYDKLKFDSNGLIPAIIQEQKTGRVVMMAWMNRASLEKTIETGKTHFWSRSRQKFWMKGEESGHTQTVKDIAFDCDGDTLLIQVDQIGAACHEGYQSCFFRSVEKDGQSFKITEPQLETPEQIYGTKK
jgi:phosphoribosyl-AMP cyclohydrolase